MPIKPENKNLYPKNWKEISLAVRQRANGKCEFCGIENYSLGHWVNDRFIKSEEAWNEMNSNGVDLYESIPTEKPFVKIVLTVAHLDHNPSNCDDSNLKALCQKCHLTYDAKHHAANARKTRNRKKYGVLSLFPISNY
ncbi:MAG TPA: hypothetical protein PK079_26295 [Leptospiraceae bacterium]|nr:hypothetical protein [Leptospiraceae bacterium]HMW08346.1 hypothetical protein [Leptospiraceae bacterium]HMX35580.1 hypothetical protein [Leptospiraceae bacterium]HMY34327.1 hypothetical protein [Leptospiraceae bacterium]HMZ67509.1 hypothetical protein [Leptospiraceae bacterium]